MASPRWPRRANWTPCSVFPRALPRSLRSLRAPGARGRVACGQSAAVAPGAWTRCRQCWTLGAKSRRWQDGARGPAGRPLRSATLRPVTPLARRVSHGPCAPSCARGAFSRRRSGRRWQGPRLPLPQPVTPLAVGRATSLTSRGGAFSPRPAPIARARPRQESRPAGVARVAPVLRSAALRGRPARHARSRRARRPASADFWGRPWLLSAVKVKSTYSSRSATEINQLRPCIVVRLIRWLKPDRAKAGAVPPAPTFPAPAGRPVKLARQPRQCATVKGLFSRPGFARPKLARPLQPRPVTPLADRPSTAPPVTPPADPARHFGCASRRAGRVSRLSACAGPARVAPGPATPGATAKGGPVKRQPSRQPDRLRSVVALLLASRAHTLAASRLAPPARAASVVVWPSVPVAPGAYCRALRACRPPGLPCGQARPDQGPAIAVPPAPTLRFWSPV